MTNATPASQPSAARTVVAAPRRTTPAVAVLSYRRFFGYALIAMAVATAPVLAWKLADVLLLAFGAVLIAALIELVAEPLVHHTPLPRWLGVLLAGLLILAILIGGAWFFGTKLSGQFADVIDRARIASGRIQDVLGRSELGRYMVGRAETIDVSIAAITERTFALTTSFLEALVILVISAIYVVAQPRTYRRGLVMLFPRDKQAEAHRIFDEVGRALRLWLLGQLMQMAIVGVLSTLAVWALGVPAPLALGIIATITEFIPYLGPILAAVPALLIALSKSPSLVLWTFGAYLVIHQIEGQLITPLIQRWLIVIPPALMLIGIAAAGALFGLLGVIFAGPLVAVAFVATRTLWVRDTLEQPI